MLVGTSLAVRPITQVEYHCGPATVAMLLDYVGARVPQQAIARAAGMSDIIDIAGGMRLDELHAGVAALYPAGEIALLARYHSTPAHLAAVLGAGLPAGVEWQGRFPDDDGTLADIGHYSVVTGIDRQRGVLTVNDPEPANVLTRDGSLALDVFERRWWELDTVPHPTDPGFAPVLEMTGLIFVAVPRARRAALERLGFQPATRSLMWQCATPLDSPQPMYR